MSYDYTDREMQERIKRFRVENRSLFALSLMVAASVGAVAVLIVQAIGRAL